MKDNRKTIYLPVVAPAILVGVFILLSGCGESDNEEHSLFT